ncbi:Thioesterase PikA5 (plasmid) [Streptomyces sp. enrichment culture]|uniref:thioesterase II family protein n=1 Tax=Streptomyces TaxID=1883 RepID=UPI0016792129|nr:MULTISPECIES: thioesterase domain-containing protein [Streptomyces]MBD3575442.1 thioesterase [Streptomyces sp. KD18]GGS93287.1 thioesterase [Streptomyces toxytricini]
MQDADRWLKRFTPASSPATGRTPGTAALTPPTRIRSRVVCLPHAGGAAPAYQPWARHLPADTELLAVQYPGRQERLGEPCADTLGELADAVAAALAALPVLPTVVFGHSMGSLVAYETVLRLARHAPQALPVRLFVSGAPAPAHDRTNLPAPDDASLLAYVRNQGAAQPEVYDIPELRELLMPSLRGDFALLARYRPARPPARVPVPVTALGGDSDAGCPPESLATWADATTADFASRVFPGGHFYLQGREDTLAGLVTTALRAAAAR